MMLRLPISYTERRGDEAVILDRQGGVRTVGGGRLGVDCLLHTEEMEGGDGVRDGRRRRRRLLAAHRGDGRRRWKEETAYRYT